MVLREDEILLERERLEEVRDGLYLDYKSEKDDYEQFRGYTFEEYLVFLYDHMCDELRASFQEIKQIQMNR